MSGRTWSKADILRCLDEAADDIYEGAASPEACKQVAMLVRNIEQQRDELLAALKDYGSHYDDCEVFGMFGDPTEKPCTCGFDRAIASVESKPCVK